MLLAMPARGFLVVNARSGDRRPTVGELRAEAERLHVAVHVLSEDEDAADAARSAEASALGVAGGDGSLFAVAAVATERRLPFVCVPFGTRNHFARDLGLDHDDPVAALEAFAGTERRVDVGRVGGKLFLNNVSLGLYAGLVHERERHRFRRQLLASARALSLVRLARRPVALSIDGEPTAARILLAANNAYDKELFSLGERDRLDEGRIYLYEVRAAVDGEPVELEPPLELTIEPQALRVLVPPG
jgi:diacylglycerol kinase family enzyme